MDVTRPARFIPGLTSKRPDRVETRTILTVLLYSTNPGCPGDRRWAVLHSRGPESFRGPAAPDPFVERMLRLHGFASSNDHIVVKAVLIEKGIDFEEVTSYPPADDEYLKMNATGKFPCLETEDGSLLGETKVMLNYLPGTG